MTVPDLPRFDRHFFDGRQRVSVMGTGVCGGKAAGLIRMRDALAVGVGEGRFPRVEVNIPTLTVVATDHFEHFLVENRLWDLTRSDAPDAHIALAFQHADLPVDLLGDLRALVEQVRQPLAIRSSSLLEDALFRPFAGVYATKMIPNNQPDADTRFRRLVEAIKFVYASTFFSDAKRYARAAGRSIEEERMAVIIQEVVGRRHRERFYPDLSGVARSYSFYRIGRARPEDGVATLALGLGRTIVDEGLGWTYSPAYPAVPPPYSLDQLLEQTQTTFWAVNMGRPPAYDPINEVEYLVRASLADAEADGTLDLVASTYDVDRDRLVPGVSGRGPRVLDFSPLLVLEVWPVNAVIRRLLEVCEQVYGGPVEIEFAATFHPESGRARVGFLQVRPMVVADDLVDVADAELASPDAVVASRRAMGNGCLATIRDIVYVRPDRFEARWTRVIAEEIAAINRVLTDERRPYVLIGFGRWGSTDPWLGIPVTWPQVAGAQVLVEATLPSFDVEISQGSHFFHNLSSFRVSYFAVGHEPGERLAWDWLAAQPAERDTSFVRHVRVERPLLVKVDGRTGRGVILAGSARGSPSP